MDKTIKEPAQTPTIVTSAEVSFPPVGDLIRESWDVLVKSIFHLFILYIVYFVAFLILGALAVVVSLLIASLGLNIPFGTILHPGGLQEAVRLFSQHIGSTIPVMLISLSVFLGTFIGLALFFQVAAILIIDGYNKQISMTDILHKSLSLIIPLFLVNILVSFFVYGSFFVFGIPALLFSYLFAFVSYEVVLEHKQWLSALARSMYIVSHNFGAIFIRLLLLMGIYLAVSFLLPNLFARGNASLIIVYGVFSILINFMLGWYGLAYSVTLYKEALADTDPNKEASLRWAWLVAILGWLIAGALLFIVYGIITSPSFKEGLQKTVKNYNNKKSMDTSSTDTRHLSLYTNPTYGFSLQYPQGWFVSEGTNDSIVTFTNTQPDTVVQNNGTSMPLSSSLKAQVAISVISMGNSTFDQAVSKSMGEIRQQLQAVIMSSEKIMTAGGLSKQTFDILFTKGHAPIRARAVVMQKGSMMFTIIGTSLTTSWSQYGSLYGTVFSSFAFTQDNAGSAYPQ